MSVDNRSRMQGMIAHRPLCRNRAIMMFRLGDVEGGRAFLRHCLEHVPNANEIAGRTPPFLQVSLTWNGIRQLVTGIEELDPDDGRRKLEPFFCEPLPTFPEELGFVGDSAPANWWEGAWSSADIDMIVHGFYESTTQAVEQVAALSEVAIHNNVTRLPLSGFEEGTLAGQLPSDGILHFGYRDGISEPDIDWDDSGRRGSVNLREILLGYSDDGGYAVPPHSDGPWKDFVRDGSLACVAWIAQDTGAFQAFLEEEAARLPGFDTQEKAQEWLASRMMGRWRDGSPVGRWPDAPPPAPDLDNTFDYTDDPDGAVCPLTAHVRVANVRSDQLKYPNRVRFPNGPPRFIRRGFSYGPPDTGNVSDGVKRGLIGTFFCARLNEQFLTVLRWIQKTSFTDRFDQKPYSPYMQDAVFGIRETAHANKRFTIKVGSSTHDVALRNFITFKGVAHAMMLSIPSLRRLAGLPS